MRELFDTTNFNTQKTDRTRCQKGANQILHGTRNNLATSLPTPKVTKLGGNSCVQVEFAALVAHQSCRCQLWRHHRPLRHGRASLFGMQTSLFQRAHDHLETSSCYSWRHNRV